MESKKDTVKQIDSEREKVFDEESIPIVIRYDGKDKITAIPEGVVKIGDYAFAGTNVEMVICSSTLKEIGNFAFRDCLNLKQIHLNRGLKHIGQAPFANCPELEEVYFYGTKEMIEK